MKHVTLACVVVSALLSVGCRPPPAEAPPAATSSPDAQAATSTPATKPSRKTQRAWD